RPAPGVAWTLQARLAARQRSADVRGDLRGVVGGWRVADVDQPGLPTAGSAETHDHRPAPAPVWAAGGGVRCLRVRLYPRTSAADELGVSGTLAMGEHRPAVARCGGWHWGDG